MTHMRSMIKTAKTDWKAQALFWGMLICGMLIVCSMVLVTRMI